MGDRRQRQRRKDRDRRRASRRERDWVAVGPGMVKASPEAVMASIASLPATLDDWETLAQDIVPVFPRRVTPPMPGGPAVQVLLPPGILTGFGIDLGLATAHVGEDLLRSWGISAQDLAARALVNLGERSRSLRARDVRDGDLDGVPVRILQAGIGCGSTLLLLPDVLARIFGTEPQVVIAPMRDVLMSMPIQTDPDLVAWIAAELSAMDPNGLDLEPFFLEGGVLRSAASGVPVLRH